MSNTQTNSKANKIHKLPFIKKDSLKSGLLLQHMYGSSNFMKEDLIFKARNDDFLKGKYPNLLIMNSLNVVKNSSRTTASYTAPNSSLIELTSDEVVKTIGQENYDKVFAALCSVINQELKIKGILSLLRCSSGYPEPVKYTSVDTQTYESSFNALVRDKLRRNTRRTSKVRSYVLKDHINTEPKKVIIHPCDISLLKDEDIKIETDDNSKNYIADTGCKVTTDSGVTSAEVSDVDKTPSKKKNSEVDDSVTLPDIKLIVDEDSNISDVGSVGALSIGSDINIPQIETNAKSILNYIDEHIEDIDDQHNDLQPGITSKLIMLDGSAVTIRGNPDIFHLVTPEILSDLLPMDQKKLMYYQAYIDWKYCLQRDEDNNLPIHSAVLNNDVNLLKRHCSVLKSRHASIDIPAAGNLTALQMSILQDYPGCTSLLLAHGADIFVRDDEARNALHLAAEVGPKHVEAVLQHCRKNARVILKENEDLWKPLLEDKSDAMLAEYLLTSINMMCDNQGYTPLMLASKIGNFASTELLLKAAPSAVNMTMPTCGNTALYNVVATACLEATNLGDKTKIPEHFQKTIEILCKNGADPSIDNNTGSNVNILLSEFNVVKLCMLITNTITSVKYFDGNKSKDNGSYILVKSQEGKINLTEVNQNKKSKKQKDESLIDVNKEKNSIQSALDILDKTTTKSTSEKNIKVAKKEDIVAKPPDKNISPKENMPVILKNLPVITKIVSLDNINTIPILVKGISPNVCAGNNSKTLKTQIVTKPKQYVPQAYIPLGNKFISKTQKYIKILPKPASNSPKTNITVSKTTPLILRKPGKRPNNQDDSEPSSSKISKT